MSVVRVRDRVRVYVNEVLGARLLVRLSLPSSLSRLPVLCAYLSSLSLCSQFWSGALGVIRSSRPLSWNSPFPDRLQGGTATAPPNPE
jgi:hypothetical protein